MPVEIGFVGSSLIEGMLVGLFLAQKKLISGKRESVSQLESMKIDEQWEC